MDEITNTLNILLKEREELLKQKEDNKDRIKECESKIKYYRWCYEMCTSRINQNKQNIESYNRIIKYEKRGEALFNIPAILSFSEEYYHNRILDFKLEIKKIEKDKETLKEPMTLYTSLMSALIIKNREIDSRLDIINEIINNEKPKIKTKGEIKW